MNSKAYAWLMVTILPAIFLIVVLLQHTKELSAVWPYIWVGLLIIIAILVAYALYTHVWHKTYSRHLERRSTSHEIKRADDELAHRKQLETQTLQYNHELNLLREQLEHERQMIALRNHVLSAGQVLVNQEREDWRIHAAAHKPLPAPQQEETVVDASVPIPQAPPFRMMYHLISEQRMPLCYTFQGETSAPAFGTIDDLLSMAVTGKPGRGKTTALMYYVCMLLKCGAEVYVFDPHGAMNELAVLNTMPLPGMPRSARIVYVDRREDMVNMVPVLLGKLDERDELYRTRKQTMHPLLLLADELPVLADYDAQIAAEYKAINKARERAGQIALEVPLMIELIRRFVLEARKWRCFFIGSGQTFDADTLPTRVTDSLNSRIVFFSSDQRARMSGLENDIVKELLPVIRNAGPGVMVFDCARWDKPMIGAIPVITMDDMMAFLGVQPGASLPDIPMRPAISGPHTTETLSSLGQNGGDYSENQGLRLVKPVPTVPNQSPEGEPGTHPGPVTGQLRASKDARFTAEQSKMFAQEYRKDMLISGKVDIKAILRRMNLSNRYYRHASIIAEHVRRETSANAAQM